MNKVTIELTVPQLRAIAILFTEEYVSFLSDQSRVVLNDQLMVAAHEASWILKDTLAAIDIEYVKQLGGNHD
jgi:hypothetical protein